MVLLVAGGLVQLLAQAEALLAAHVLPDGDAPLVQLGLAHGHPQPGQVHQRALQVLHEGAMGWSGRHGPMPVPACLSRMPH
jgi:hypothetical protein